MIEQMRSSGNSETGEQIDLSGKMVDEYCVESLDGEQLGTLKSALQKSIRQGNVEKAMYFAWKLAEQNW